MPQIEARHSWDGKAPDQPRQRKFTLFGGEPLLPLLRPLVEYILDRARRGGPFSISAITNGTELAHFADIVGPDGISFLQITLDGAPREHDRRRVGPSGAPTFTRIADNIDLALNCGAQVKVRINADRNNVDSLPELAERMADRGWFAHPAFSAYATPVHDSPENSHDTCGLGSWNLGRALTELSRTHPAVRHIDGADSALHRRVRQILRNEKDPLDAFQPTFCGAHTRIWLFDAHGDIYACWERAGYPQARIGRVTGDGRLLIDESVERTWRQRSIAANPVCGRCPYAFYCGGGCAVLAELKNGKLYSNYCDDFAKRFKDVAAEQVRAVQIEQVVASLRPPAHAPHEGHALHEGGNRGDR